MTCSVLFSLILSLLSEYAICRLALLISHSLFELWNAPPRLQFAHGIRRLACVVCAVSGLRWPRASLHVHCHCSDSFLCEFLRSPE